MKNAKAKPLGDRVLVEPIINDEKTKGGILIPNIAKEKPNTGTVIAVGPGDKDITMEVSVGDIVLYGKGAGAPMDLPEMGKDLLMMKQSDILMVV